MFGGDSRENGSMMLLWRHNLIADLLGVLAILLILWGFFRSLQRINKTLEDIKGILQAKNSK